jgi:hypothetical protein
MWIQLEILYLQICNLILITQKKTEDHYVIESITNRSKPGIRLQRIHKNTVPTSQRTQSVLITNTNELILFREVIANNCENYKKYIHTEFVNGTLDLKRLPHYSGHNDKKVNTHP